MCIGSSADGCEWQGVKQAPTYSKHTPPYTHILTSVWMHCFSLKIMLKRHSSHAVSGELRKDSLLLQSFLSQCLTSWGKKKTLSQSSKAQIRRKQSDTKPLKHRQFSFLLQSSWASCCLFVCFFSLFEGSFSVLTSPFLRSSFHFLSQYILKHLSLNF